MLPFAPALPPSTRSGPSRAAASRSPALAFLSIRLPEVTIGGSAPGWFARPASAGCHRARRARRRAHARFASTALPGETAFVEVGAPLATGLHQVDNPVFDRDGNLYVTYSGVARTGGAGLDLPSSGPTARASRSSSGSVNPTSMAFDPRRSSCTCRAGSRAACHRVERGRHARAVFATDLGVACGLAFAPDGTLFVGDRSGTIFRVENGRRCRVFATLPPSVAAFHLAIGPDGALYVTAPTLGAARPRLPHRTDGDGRDLLSTASAGRRGWRSTRTARCTSSTRSPAAAGCTASRSMTASPSWSSSGGRSSASPSIRTAGSSSRRATRSTASTSAARRAR